MFYDIINKLISSKSLPNKIEYINRFLSLLSAVEKKELVIAEESIMGFINFINSFPGIRTPLISLDSCGRIKASWSRLSMTFLEDEIVYFTYRIGMDKLSGIITVNNPFSGYNKLICRMAR